MSTVAPWGPAPTIDGAPRVANAPCSWGALEFDEVGGGHPPDARQVLAEIQATGYAGTELGDWGFLPTDPSALNEALARHRLAMAGAFVPVALREAGRHAEGAAHAVRVARLLAATRCQKGAPPPLLVLADENGTDPMRTRCAGRITPAQGLTEPEWTTFARGAERVARAVLEETGVRTAFHPHCAGFVETPEETARLLAMTDPALVGLTFDTGHYAYGSGQCDRSAVLYGLERFGDRLRHVHLKGCDPHVAARARAEGWDYSRAVRNGLFCELDRGCVDVPSVLDWLRRHAYQGWIVVEQDVLPGMGTPRESAARNRATLAAAGL